MGPRTFATVQEFLSHQLCSGANEDHLQKDLCHKPRLPGLLLSVPLTPRQATVNPGLRWSLLGTHRQVWLSLLWGHCSFLLGPGAHKVLFVPCKSLFPQSCRSSVIKSHWPPKSNSLGVLSPFVAPPGRAFLVAQLVKNLPAGQENQVQTLGWEDALKKEMATHSSTCAWRTPWTRGV